MDQDRIYVDHAATTPLRPEVREAMEPHLRGEFGNPSSSHRWGRRALAALEEARSALAASCERFDCDCRARKIYDE